MSEVREKHECPTCRWANDAPSLTVAQAYVFACAGCGASLVATRNGAESVLRPRPGKMPIAFHAVRSDESPVRVSLSVDAEKMAADMKQPLSDALGGYVASVRDTITKASRPTEVARELSEKLRKHEIAGVVGSVVSHAVRNDHDRPLDGWGDHVIVAAPVSSLTIHPDGLAFHASMPHPGGKANIMYICRKQTVVVVSGGTRVAFEDIVPLIKAWTMQGHSVRMYGYKTTDAEPAGRVVMERFSGMAGSPQVMIYERGEPLTNARYADGVDGLATVLPKCPARRRAEMLAAAMIPVGKFRGMEEVKDDAGNVIGVSIAVEASVEMFKPIATQRKVELTLEPVGSEWDKSVQPIEAVAYKPKPSPLAQAVETEARAGGDITIDGMRFKCHKVELTDKPIDPNRFLVVDDPHQDWSGLTPEKKAAVMAWWHEMRRSRDATPAAVDYAKEVPAAALMAECKEYGESPLVAASRNVDMVDAIDYAAHGIMGMDRREGVKPVWSGPKNPPGPITLTLIDDAIADDGAPKSAGEAYGEMLGRGMMKQLDDAILGLGDGPYIATTGGATTDSANWTTADIIAAAEKGRELKRKHDAEMAELLKPYGEQFTTLAPGQVPAPVGSRKEAAAAEPDPFPAIRAPLWAKLKLAEYGKCESCGKPADQFKFHSERHEKAALESAPNGLDVVRFKCKNCTHTAVCAKNHESEWVGVGDASVRPEHRALPGPEGSRI